MSQHIYITDLDNPTIPYHCKNCGMHGSVTLGVPPGMNWVLYFSQDIEFCCRQCQATIEFSVRGLKPNPTGEIGAAQTPYAEELWKLERRLQPATPAPTLPPPAAPALPPASSGGQRSLPPKLREALMRTPLKQKTPRSRPNHHELRRSLFGAGVSVVVLLAAVISLSLSTIVLGAILLVLLL